MAFTSDVVEATLILKKEIKKDLSGDVIFKNAPGIAAMTATSSAVTDVITEGFNFFKMRKVNLIAGTAKVKVNAVTLFTITATGSFTPATPTIELFKTGSPVLTLSVIFGTASIKIAQVPQINERYSVMQ